MAASPGIPRFFSAHAASDEPADAARQAADSILRQTGGRPIDLALLFLSGDLIAAADEIVRLIQDRLSPGVLLGSSAEGIIEGGDEFEGGPGISLLAASLPGATLRTFTDEALPSIPEEPGPDVHDLIADVIGAEPDLRLVLLFIDPFSVPMGRLLPALNRARRTDDHDHPIGRVVGGLASGATAPGQARLILNDRVISRGLVGVSISGDIRCDTIVSQGCRPVGQPLVVTRARGNVILQLGGRPALDVIQEIVSELPEADRARARQGLMVGRVINEYKERFGRSDFLIRNIMGADETQKAIAISEILRTGQTIQLHVRDAITASQDLALLLDAQKLHEPPDGVLLITCNGRGSRLFPVPNHDATKVFGAFSAGRPGEDAAKGGAPIQPPTAGPPLAGFFASGEIGPVGDDSYLHGQTACAVLFRRP